MPYASHAATGSGRTPIGILLFAASHLLLGAALGLMAALMWRAVPRKSELTAIPAAMLLLILIGVIAALMLVGSVMLLCKGSRAWRASVISFTLLALVECCFVGFGAGMVRWFMSADRTGVIMGIVLALVATALLVLCVILLGYLGAEKSRRTFALSPGEMPPLVRQLPRLAMGAWLLAILAGSAMGQDEFWAGHPRMGTFVTSTARVVGTPSAATEPSAVIVTRGSAAERNGPLPPSTTAPTVTAPSASPSVPPEAAARLTSVGFAPDGRLITGDDAGNLAFRDLASGARQAFHLNHPGFCAMRTAPSGKWIALAFADQPVIWDAATQAETKLSAAGPVVSVAWSGDGRMLATGHGGGEVRVWIAPGWTQSATLSPGVGAVTSLSFSPDGRTLAMAGSGGVAIGDVPEKRVKQKLNGSAAAFAPDGKTLAVAGEHAAALYEPLFWQRTAELAHPQRLTCIAHAGGLIITGCGDGNVRTWDVATKQVHSLLHGLDGSVDSIAVSNDGRTLAAIGGGKARVWDVLTAADHTPPP